ncbi:MAG: ABC transporter substrate-binding protein [Thermomicrobiales bacterium]|nr:ABC transporter substrate-binding protein [Thermomicrobiales bacterium]
MTEERLPRPADQLMLGNYDRRAVLRRAMVLGLASPLMASMLKAAPAGAQDASPAAAPSGEPVKIGMPYNLTGSQASLDGPSANGSKLAAKEINAAGGVLGRPLELVIEDGKSDVPTVTSVTKKLIEEDGVHALAGLSDTSYVLAAGPVAQDAQKPFLDTGGTAPIITSVGDYIFMLPFGDNVQAAVAAEFAGEQGWKTAALLYDEGMDYTKFLAKYFKDRFTMEDLGGQIVSELTYTSGDTDFSSQMTQFKNLDPQPDFIFISSGPDEIGTIVKQARDAGLNLPIVGGDGYDTPLLAQLAGAAATDIYFTTHQGIYGDDPAANAFKEAYKADYGTEPESVFAALGYDGVKLMADAISRANSTEGPAIRDALAATHDFKGVTGTISYENGSRIPSKSVALIKVTDGKNELLKVVVPKTVPPA